ncbi:tyrosine-type recombinase/integrase [Candidatus Aerophobetes bacterium]|nr:tyrosine-type recombinase/integrase [Candidatus Aerophobetes bacterium]
MGEVHENPTDKAKFFKENNHRLRYLTKEEIKALYNAAAEHLKPIIVIALNTGMRKGEILNLKWEDIDFRQKIIYIKYEKRREKRDTNERFFI